MDYKHFTVKGFFGVVLSRSGQVPESEVDRFRRIC